jgi:hypothetical protein
MSLTLTGTYSPSQLREGSTIELSLALTNDVQTAGVDTTGFTVSLPADVSITAMAITNSTGVAAPTPTIAHTYPIAGQTNYTFNFYGSCYNVTWTMKLTLVGAAGAYGLRPLTVVGHEFSWQSGYLSFSPAFQTTLQLINANGQGAPPKAAAGVGLEATGAKALRITATISTEASGYSIALRNAAGATVTTHTFGGNGQITQNFTHGVAAGGATPTIAESTTYSVAITATNEYGSADATASNNVVTPAAPSTPDAVTNTAAIGISHTQIQLT